MNLKINNDKIGIALSIGCAVHCLLVPLILPLIPLFGLALPGHSGIVHIAFAMSAAIISIPIIFKYEYPVFSILLLVGILILLLSGVAEYIVANKQFELTIITLVGSCFVIFSHYMNHKYSCLCKHHK